MVTIKDGCGATSCCDWKQKLEEAYKRATASVNKIGDDAGSIYYPDGTGYVKLPLPTRAQVAQIQENADDIATLKQRTTTSEGDINTLEQDVARIDAKDTAQDTSIKDNSDRITSTNNDLVATEATVATHDSDIITLKAQSVALGKSLVSDVIMTDGTTAGSVQVSIEREDGALITSANYKWGRDIGVRLEAGTQAGYMKTVIDLSDGTTLTSNEYKIVEVLESDVYVTAITLVPDMTAGTIGGTISYSNGTTQTINAVNVPTAPGVTSAIEALQGRMTAVEQKNTQQDSSISALDSRVKAIEDTPGVGQFGAGKLGTIAGSTTDGRIKAEDDGTGSVNGWSDLKSRVTTAEGQIVTAQNDISALDGTVAQQTTDISGLMTDVTNLQNKNTAQDQSIAANTSAIAEKVAISQGVANAGKALVVGSDGNVTNSFITSGIPTINPTYVFTLPPSEGTKSFNVGNRNNGPILETNNNGIVPYLMSDGKKSVLFFKITTASDYSASLNKEYCTVPTSEILNGFSGLKSAPDSTISASIIVFVKYNNWSAKLADVKLTISNGEITSNVNNLTIPFNTGATNIMVGLLINSFTLTSMWSDLVES